MNEEDLYNEAIELWGTDSQVMMLFEEMAELQKALSKRFRAKTPTEKFKRQKEVFT